MSVPCATQRPKRERTHMRALVCAKRAQRNRDNATPAPHTACSARTCRFCSSAWQARQGAARPNTSVPLAKLSQRVPTPPQRSAARGTLPSGCFSQAARLFYARAPRQLGGRRVLRIGHLNGGAASRRGARQQQRGAQQGEERHATALSYGNIRRPTVGPLVFSFACRAFRRQRSRSLRTAPPWSVRRRTAAPTAARPATAVA